MKPILVLLVSVVAVVGAAGVVGADAGGAPQPAPGDETTTNESNTTGVSPGQQLAGAVGAQGASLGGELWNRTLSERLSNATTPSERAQVIVDENETLVEHLDALTGVRANLTEAWADGELSEGQYRASLTAFVVRARTVELRANQTARAAESLSASVRERHDVNATRIRRLGERAHELYQFEGPVGRDVADETLANESALVAANRTADGPIRANNP